MIDSPMTNKNTVLGLQHTDFGHLPGTNMLNQPPLGAEYHPWTTPWNLCRVCISDACHGYDTLA